MPVITKISHGLTIGDLKFGNARPGVVEATLKQGETMEDALDELDERLTEWHKKRYPHLYQDSKSEGSGERDLSNWQPGAQRRPETLPTISKDTEKLEIAIDNATTIEELQSIKDQCGKSGLMGQYIAKIQSFKY